VNRLNLYIQEYIRITKNKRPWRKREREREREIGRRKGGNNVVVLKIQKINITKNVSDVNSDL
jgi:hypothetical protein